MALTEEKKAEWKKTLMDLGVLFAEENIEEHTQGDSWWFTSQTRGNFFFSEEKMIFVSGWGVEQIVIPYKNIREMKKCFVGPFIPTGIKITALNEQGKEKKYKFSVLKRDNWIEYISGKSGVALS